MRAPADPQMQAVVAAHEAVEVDAARTDAKQRGGGALDAHELGPTEPLGDRKHLAAPAGDHSLREQHARHPFHRGRAGSGIGEGGRQAERAIGRDEDRVERGQAPGDVVAHVADMGVGDKERSEARKVVGVAGGDAVAKTHERSGTGVGAGAHYTIVRDGGRRWPCACCARF